MLHSSDDFYEVDISSITFHGVLLAKDRVQSLKNVQFAKSKIQNTVHTCFNWREKSKENLPVSRTHQRY